MHPDRLIVRMYRRSDVLLTRPDNQNTLTCQSADTYDSPRDPLHGPVTLVINDKIYSHPKMIKTCVVFSIGKIFQTV